MPFLVVFALHPFISWFVRKWSFCKIAREVLTYFCQLLNLGQTGTFRLKSIEWVFRLFRPFKVLLLFVCVHMHTCEESVFQDVKFLRCQEGV